MVNGIQQTLFHCPFKLHEKEAQTFLSLSNFHPLHHFQSGYFGGKQSVLPKCVKVEQVFFFFFFSSFIYIYRVGIILDLRVKNQVKQKKLPCPNEDEIQRNMPRAKQLGRPNWLWRPRLRPTHPSHFGRWQRNWVT